MTEMDKLILDLIQFAPAVAVLLYGLLPRVRRPDRPTPGSKRHFRPFPCSYVVPMQILCPSYVLHKLLLHSGAIIGSINRALSTDRKR